MPCSVAITMLELHLYTSSVARGHTTYRPSFFKFFLDSKCILQKWNSLQPLVDCIFLDAFKQGVLSCSIPKSQHHSVFDLHMYDMFLHLCCHTQHGQYSNDSAILYSTRELHCIWGKIRIEQIK